MPEACATWGLPSSISRPLTRTVPESGESTPERTFIMVLLPAPFSPTSPCTSPIPAANEAPSSAFTAPKDFEMPAPSIAGAMLLGSLSDTSLSYEERGVCSRLRLGQVDSQVAPAGLAGLRGGQTHLDRRVRTAVREGVEEAVLHVGEDRDALLDGLVGHGREGDGDVLPGVVALKDAAGELQRDDGEERRLAYGKAFDLLSLVADHELAEAVLGLTRGRGQRPARAEKGLEHTIRPALGPDAVDRWQGGQDGGRVALGDRGVPHPGVAVDDVYPGVLLPDALRALVPILVHRCSGDPRDHDDVALATELVHEPGGQLLAELELVRVGLERLLGGHGVVERDDEYVLGGRLLDDAVKPRRRGCVYEDGVDPLGDQVGYLLGLLADLVARVEDRALHLRLERLHLEGRLELVHHLDAPLVANVGVGELYLELLAARGALAAPAPCEPQRVRSRQRGAANLQEVPPRERLLQPIVSHQEYPSHFR